MSAPRGLALFDLDGTLVDSAPDIADAVDRALAVCGRAPVGEAVVRTHIGNGASRLIHRALTGERDRDADSALHAQAYDAFLGFYEERLCVRTRLYDGVVTVLTTLAARGWRLGCVTNKPGRFTVPLLAALGLERHFGIVLSGDSLAQKKPDPEPLLHAAATLGVALADTVMIGDSAADLDAAAAAGIPAVCVSYGYAGALDPRSRGVPVIDRMEELLPLLARDRAQ